MCRMTIATVEVVLVHAQAVSTARTESAQQVAKVIRIVNQVKSAPVESVWVAQVGKSTVQANVSAPKPIPTTAVDVPIPAHQDRSASKAIAPVAVVVKQPVVDNA